MTRQELIRQAKAALRGELPKEQKVFIFYMNQSGEWISDSRNPASVPTDSDLVIKVRYPAVITDFKGRPTGIYSPAETKTVFNPYF